MGRAGDGYSTTVSIHAFRGEGDSASQPPKCQNDKFQSTPSGGKATHLYESQYPASQVSIHAFRGEGDKHHSSNRARRYGRFNPRLPGGRRRAGASPSSRSKFVSIHAFRGEGDPWGRRLLRFLRVSIHAFRGEGDSLDRTTGSSARSFNPRLPGGRRLAGAADGDAACGFQSTPSGGKATMR